MSSSEVPRDMPMSHVPLSASVVICAYTERRWDAINAAVRSVQAQSRPPEELVVVVDHNDALYRRLHAHQPTVRVVASEETPGLAGARNCGIAATSGDVVVFLDDDAQAACDWLELLLDAFGDERVLGVGGALTPSWSVPRPSWFPEEFLWVVGCSYRGLPEAASPVRNMIGASMSFRRTVFERVGTFRHDFARVGGRPFGVEETELCIRARRGVPGGYFLYEPRARAEHRVTADRTKVTYFLRLCSNEGYAKARMAAEVGAEVGLGAERSHLLHVLPRATCSAVWQVARGELSGASRAAAIVAGVSAAALGYVRGRVGLAAAACRAQRQIDGERGHGVLLKHGSRG